MIGRSHLGVRIFGAIVSLILCAAELFAGPGSPPRVVQVLTVVGAALMFVFFLVWEGDLPAWIQWALLIAAILCVSSNDVHEVMIGERHWARLIPLPAMILVLQFATGRKEDGPPADHVEKR